MRFTERYVVTRIHVPLNSDVSLVAHVALRERRPHLAIEKGGDQN
jgi:hypothetical protein